MTFIERSPLSSGRGHLFHGPKSSIAVTLFDPAGRIIPSCVQGIFSKLKFRGNANFVYHTLGCVKKDIKLFPNIEQKTSVPSLPYKITGT